MDADERSARTTTRVTASKTPSRGVPSLGTMTPARHRSKLRPVALVALGGVVGAVARHAVTLSLPSGVLGTLAVNVVGSFALGALLSESRLADALSPDARLLLATGVLSSFTTYSTFAVETASLSPRLAAANVAGTYALGFLAAVLGQVVAGWLS